MKTCSVVLTIESVDEILWCEHSNKSTSTVLLHGTIYFSIFYEIKFGIYFFNFQLIFDTLFDLSDLKIQKYPKIARPRLL